MPTSASYLPKSENISFCHPVRQTLKAIYLDTACLMSNNTQVTKDQACSDLITLLSYYSHDTFFYLNTWTWGYEPILTAIASAFNTKIHFDRYKGGIYSSLSHPFMRGIMTKDPTTTRFHACERFDRCEEVGEHCRREVVYVNPVNMGSEKWNAYFQDALSKLKEGERALTLVSAMFLT